MKTTHIKDKLNQLECPVGNFVLGDFDAIGEVTAKKSRKPDSPLYKTAGCFFRPNYERGLLISALIQHYDVESYLEIGFGRGYSTLCAAMTISQLHGNRTVTTVDPNYDENHVGTLSKMFPNQWLQKITYIKGKSQDVLPELLKKNTHFDMIYVDGDHTYAGVKKDWELIKNAWGKVVLFDDYHLPTKTQKDIECAKLIDEISDYQKELVIMDRRIFCDDRQLSDEEIDYGQVIVTK